MYSVAACDDWLPYWTAQDMSSLSKNTLGSVPTDQSMGLVDQVSFPGAQFPGFEEEGAGWWEATNIVSFITLYVCPYRL